MEDLEAQQTIIYESNTEYTKELKEQLASLTAELETTKEQQVDLQPFKDYILAQKAKMMQLQIDSLFLCCLQFSSQRSQLLFQFFGVFSIGIIDDSLLCL